MMAAKDRLKTPTKQNNGDANASIPLRVQPPNINMKMPEIKIPDIKSDVQVDTAPIAAVLEQAMQVLAQLSQQQAAILQVLQQLAGKDANVSVEAPKVTVQAAKRPGAYYVEFDREDGETVGMRISAETSH